MAQPSSERMKRYYAESHILNAAFLARQALAVEKAFTGAYDEESAGAYQAYIIGAIFASVAFLESLINQVFEEAHAPMNGIDQPLEADTVKLMAAMWKHGLADKLSYSILEKYQIALDLAGRPPFPKDQGPYPDVAILVELRNILTHYKPSLVEVGTGSNESKFENKLRTKVKPSNPLLHPTYPPYYLDKYLCHDCAKWAVESGLRFVHDFFVSMGMRTRFDEPEVLDRLRAE